MIAPSAGFIFSDKISFTRKAIETFHFQYAHNDPYKRYVAAINCKPGSVKKITDIPFLPVSFFKTHRVSTDPKHDVVFESSGTTGLASSKHFVKDVLLYEESFLKGFMHFYGDLKNYCILGLLPSYLERQGSSLVYMVKKMMELSGHPLNDFHLYNHRDLANKLEELESSSQKTLLIGVTYALLDFCQAFPMPLNYTLVMETGGMKGRQKEILRQEVHDTLKNAFQINAVHSEYGMTELLSQAYAQQGGRFQTPGWMKVLLREEDDPFYLVADTSAPKTGALNIIDLANVYSCSFIATDDIGKLHPDGSFEVLGRIDNSDIRGCSLMSL